MSESLVLFPTAKSRYVIDTWPVMEWLKNRQPHANIFRGMIERAIRGEIALSMSMVNLGEVYYTSAREWGRARAEEILSRISELPILLISISDEEVLSAARLKALYPISYADAFAAALAIRLSCPLITGDGDFHLLEDAGLLHLEWLGV